VCVRVCVCVCVCVCVGGGGSASEELQLYNAIEMKQTNRTNELTRGVQQPGMRFHT
jgi:hypothetical protein